MMKAKEIIQNFSGPCGIWVAPAEDVDLAAVAEYVVANKIPAVSCTPDAVARMWPWLEKSGTKIYARLYLDASARGYTMAVSDLCARVRAAFQNGADGAQIFIKVSDLRRFVNELGAVRDDLFFNKMLNIGLDISDVDPTAWPDVLSLLNSIRATSVTFAITKYDEKKSDFVGRVYGALNSWNESAPDMHFALGANIVPMGQTMRLIDKIIPDVAKNTLYWVRW